jgi:hypothetical protein
MTDFISLTCPSCGGKLQITPDIERFACQNCGNEHIVRRSGGIVSIAPIEAGLSKIQAGTDKTAAELAYKRTKEEFQDMENRLENVLTVGPKRSRDLFRSWLSLRLTRSGKGTGTVRRRSIEELLNALRGCSLEEIKNIIPDNVRPGFTLNRQIVEALLSYRQLAVELAKQRQNLAGRPG